MKRVRIWAVWGGGRGCTSHHPRCLRIFLMTSSSSMKANIRIRPWHLGQQRGSTFPDQVRDRLQFFESVWPSSFDVPLSSYPVPGYRVSNHPRFVFSFCLETHCCSSHNSEPSARPCWEHGNIWRQSILRHRSFSGFSCPWTCRPPWIHRGGRSSSPGRRRHGRYIGRCFPWPPHLRIGFWGRSGH